jgi:DNA polymerase-3 subunit delta
VVVLTGGGTKASPLAKAVQEVIDTNVGRRDKDVAAYLTKTFEEEGLQFDGSVISQIVHVLGEEVSRVKPLATLLRSVYGTAPLKFSHIEPYLGTEGNVPEWDLTDAVDNGNTREAVGVVSRMLQSEGREPVQIVGIFERHYLRAAALVGVDVRSAEDAAAILTEIAGRKVAPFTGGKMLRVAKSLGSEGLSKALRIVSDADRDVKGATKLEPEAVVEVLAARLARLNLAARRR